MLKKLWASLTIVLIALVAIVSFSQKSSPNEIRIGSILILSGEGASWGEASRNGIDLAVADINARGGIEGKRIVVTHEDNQSEPKLAIAALQKLNSAGINFVIGPSWSNSGLPLIDLANKSKTLMISPSLGLKDFNEGSPYLFNTWPHDETLSRNLADYIYEAGHHRVVVFGVQDNWTKIQSRAFQERFEQLGGTVALLYEPLSTETDSRAEIAKLKTIVGIDAIVMTDSSFGIFSTTGKQLRELGITSPMYSISPNAQQLTNCMQACEGLEYLTFLTPSTAFETRYKATYNREVEIGSDSAYDAVMMLAKAMEATHSTDTTVVATYLADIKEYQGVSGHLVSDGKRAFTKPYKVMQVVNGEPVDVKK